MALFHQMTKVKKGISIIDSNYRKGWFRVGNQLLVVSPSTFNSRSYYCSKLLEKQKSDITDTLVEKNIIKKSEECIQTNGSTFSERRDYSIREHFIPLTRRSTVRYLIEEKNFLKTTEQKKLEDFSLALHGIVVGQYHGVLEELKILFDPLNPDKETAITRKVSLKERIDMEFWLLQKLSVVMEKANFYELPKHVVTKALSEHDTREGVKVNVSPEKYSVMKFWAIGRNTPPTTISYFEQLSKALYEINFPKIIKNLFQPMAPLQYYKRVVVAVRLKTDKKLMLKAFKEVPVGALEQLLPDGTIKMSNFDQTVLTTSIMIGSLGIFANIITYLANIQVQWTLIVAGITAFVAGRTWALYKTRRNTYLVQLNRMLYYKNVANNRSLLTLLVDRAEDETFKEALLAYTFLLTERPPSAIADANENDSKLTGGITQALLEKNVEAWVRAKIDSDVDFNSQESVEFLESLGLLKVEKNKLYVVPLDMALKLLPPPASFMSYKTLEEDVFEGYDKDCFLDDTISEDIRKSRYGWA